MSSKAASCGCPQVRSQFFVPWLVPSEAFTLLSLRDGPQALPSGRSQSGRETARPEEAGEGKGWLPWEPCLSFPSRGIYLDPFILPASWLLDVSREPESVNEGLFRVTLCSACAGEQPILLTVYKACYSCSAILSSTQLCEVQPNGNPGLLVLCPMEGVQGLRTSPQVSTQSRESPGASVG